MRNDAARAAIPETGYLRLRDVLKFFPVSRWTFRRGVKEGRYPQAVQLSPRIVAWRAEDIRRLIEQPNGRARNHA